jgi:hypothetical protein
MKYTKIKEIQYISEEMKLIHSLDPQRFPLPKETIPFEGIIYDGSLKMKNYILKKAIPLYSRYSPFLKKYSVEEDDLNSDQKDKDVGNYKKKSLEIEELWIRGRHDEIEEVEIGDFVYECFDDYWEIPYFDLIGNLSIKKYYEIIE